jgi:chaperonin GroES
MKIQPLDDRILIEPEGEAESKTKGGIIIPDTAKEKPRIGIVRAVGVGKTAEGEKELKDLIKEGDKVLYSKYSGDEIEMEGKKLLVVKREDILAIIK